MYPKDGYLLAQMTFSPSTVEEINLRLIRVNQTLELAGLTALPGDNYEKEILDVTLEQLKMIVSLKNEVIDFGMIHPKVEKSTEYIQLHNLVTITAKNYLIKVETLVDRLTKDMYAEFSKIIRELDSFKHKRNHTGYHFQSSDFKPLLDETIGDKVKLQYILSYDHNYEIARVELFSALKQRVLAKKANIKGLVESLGTKVLDVEKLKDIDELAYEYLRIKAFGDFTEEFFHLNIPLDKTSYQHIISPNEHLADMFEVDSNEMVVLMISTDPIGDLGFSVGDLASSPKHPSLTYEISKEQIQTKQPAKINHQVDEDLNVQIVVPIYISYLKASLIKEQTRKSIKNI